MLLNRQFKDVFITQLEIEEREKEDERERRRQERREQRKEEERRAEEEERNEGERVAGDGEKQGSEGKSKRGEEESDEEWLLRKREERKLVEGSNVPEKTKENDAGEVALSVSDPGIEPRNQLNTPQEEEESTDVIKDD